jgi:hypothetical protein
LMLRDFVGRFFAALKRNIRAGAFSSAGCHAVAIWRDGRARTDGANPCHQCHHDPATDGQAGDLFCDLYRVANTDATASDPWRSVVVPRHLSQTITAEEPNEPGFPIAVTHS